MSTARLRSWAPALGLAVLAWSAGCATTIKPAIEPSFAARTYTPIRIALLPPDVFMVLDQVGDNDPAKSEALRQAVVGELVKFSGDAFRQRGYDLDLSARWDGIVGQNGQLLVTRDELAWMANGILQFANSPSGGKQGPFAAPEIVAPELAAKIGWATQSDALLYVNLKGVTVSNGKRTAQILGAVFIVVVLALIVLALLAEGKSGNGGANGARNGWTGAGGRSAVAAPVRGVPARGAGVPGSGFVTGGSRGPAPIGRGPGLVPVGGGRYYGGGPQIGFGFGVIVPLDGPVYTHEGQVTHEDEWYGGDQMYVSMTLVNSADGRVLWHLRTDLDFDAENPKDVQAMVNRIVGAIPLRGDLVDQSRAADKR